MSKLDRNPPGLRRWARLALVCAGVLTTSLVFALASPAWAHGHGETTQGYLLVQQALGHLAHDTTHIGVMAAIEKVDDALKTKDQRGVDVGELKQAKVALDGDHVGEARTLLQHSISAAVKAMEPATGELTGTTVVLTPLRGRGGLTGQDWGFGVASLLMMVAGLALSVYYRPRDSIRQLRRQLAPPGSSTISDPAANESQP